MWINISFYSLTENFIAICGNALYKLNPVGKSVCLTFLDANFSFRGINYNVVHSRAVMFYLLQSRLVWFLIGKGIIWEKVNNCKLYQMYSVDIFVVLANHPTFFQLKVAFMLATEWMWLELFHIVFYHNKFPKNCCQKVSIMAQFLDQFLRFFIYLMYLYCAKYKVNQILQINLWEINNAKLF